MSIIPSIGPIRSLRPRTSPKPLQSTPGAAYLYANVGYTRTANGLQLKEQKPIDIIGAGDIVSTAADLARFDFAFDDDRFLRNMPWIAPLVDRIAGSVR